MDIKIFWEQSTAGEKIALAKAVDTSVAYLGILAGGHRKPSPKLVKRLIVADPRFTAVELRPDIYAGLQAA